MAAPSCLICQEEFNNKLYYSAPVNGDADRKVCVICLTTMMTRVINNDDEYPIRLQHPGDLRPLDYPYYFDDAFIEQYKLKEIEHNTFPNDRVYCECMKSIGCMVKLGPGETYIAIGTCKEPDCGKKACLICASHLDQANLLAAMNNHDCKETLAAKEEDFQKIKDSDERGTNFQLCPTCSRSIQLSEACNHITCPCSTEFCYLCGKPATAHSGHWDSGPGSCSQYSRQNAVAQLEVPRGAIRGLFGRHIDLLMIQNNDGERIEFELRGPGVNDIEIVDLDRDAIVRFENVVVDEVDRAGYMARRAARDANGNRNPFGPNARARDFRNFEHALAAMQADADENRTTAELDADEDDDQAAAEDDERRQGRPVSPPIRAPFAAHEQHRRMVAREDNRPVAPEPNMLDRMHVDANHARRRRGLPQQEVRVPRTRQDARQPAQNDRSPAFPPPHAQRQPAQTGHPEPLDPRHNRSSTIPPHAQRQSSQNNEPSAEVLTPPPAPGLRERVLHRLIPDTLRTRAQASALEQRGRNHATPRRAVRPEHAPQGPQGAPRRRHNDGNGGA
jgi:hypothetical protein